MRQEYLCDDKTPTSFKFNIFITFLFEHYVASTPFSLLTFLRLLNSYHLPENKSSERKGEVEEQEGKCQHTGHDLKFNSVVLVRFMIVINDERA